MSDNFDNQLLALNIDLPQPMPPRGNSVAAARVGSLVFLSGQISQRSGKVVYQGKLGESISVDEGYQAAALCALNLIAQLRAYLNGSLATVRRCVRLSIFVSSHPSFVDQPKVANGASDIMLKIFGRAGEHARTAVGVATLPLDAAVEIEAIFETTDSTR